MQPLPHHYNVTVKSEKETHLHAAADQLPDLTIAPPADFDGPGDQWSPEHLLMASVASCYVATFKAMAGFSNLEWQSISCDVQGKLDKVDKKMKFSEIRTTAKLILPHGTDTKKADKLLHQAEENCLISNSLDVESQLSVEISTR